MLLAQNITLSRSGRKIFEDISLSLTSGKIVIIKGRNGSGKTSFLKTILNILEPSSGSIYWKGKIINKNLYDYYKNVTYISDKTSSIRQLSVYENIKIWKKIFISDVSYKQIKKLELLRLIIENKKIWILDEPFTNLDIESIEMISQTFMDHSNNSGCIIFSSHQKPQIEVTEEINL